jgi:hypothetical protein
MMEASIRSILRCLLVLQRMLLLQTIRRTTHAGGLAPPTGELVLVMRDCRIVIKSGRVISRIRGTIVPFVNNYISFQVVLYKYLDILTAVHPRTCS